MSRYQSHSFDDGEINPFANPTSVPAATSKLSPLPPEPYDRGATMDIPLDSGKDLKAKEKELREKEAELKRREQEIKRKEDAIAQGIFVNIIFCRNLTFRSM
jgi:hypothetical protein